MQDTDLFTKHPPDNEQRLDQYRHIGEVLDKLLDARLKHHRPQRYAARIVAVRLVICAFNIALMCRVSTQITGKSASARTV